jgi:general secretion pathway protein D/MSHA biogenesis protein MshL
MPFVKQKYKTGTGGNVLGNQEESNNIDGTIELKSDDNDFDVWKSVEENLNGILDVWTTKR